MTNIVANFAESAKLKQAICSDATLIENLNHIADLFSKALLAGGKIVFCGNGGSCADAQHLAAELLIRLKSNNNRPALAAIALAQDTSTITACGNDLGFDNLYQRLTQALVKPEDVLVGISTSGLSQNIILALQAAQKIDAKTVGFLGNDGGKMALFCDHHFIVPSNITARIQEAHITAGHAIIEQVELRLQQLGYIKFDT